MNLIRRLLPFPHPGRMYNRPQTTIHLRPPQRSTSRKSFMFFHILMSETSAALASSTDSGICLASTSSMCSFTGGILSPACHAGTGGRASTRAETASTSKILSLNGESCLDYRIIPILTYFSSLSIILLIYMRPGSIGLAGIPRKCPRLADFSLICPETSFTSAQRNMR